MKRNPFCAAGIAVHISGASKPGSSKANTGKPVTAARVRYMLRNPEAGQNRARLTSALIEMGLTKEGAEMFIGVKQTEK